MSTVKRKISQERASNQSSFLAWLVSNKETIKQVTENKPPELLIS